MYRIDVASAVASKPAPSALGTQGWFRDADASSGIQGTVVPADWVNMVQAELEGIRDINGAVAASKIDLGQCQAGIQAYVQATSVWPRTHIRGFLVSRDAGDPTNDIRITEGECRDKGDNASYSFTGPYVKQIDSAWAPGSPAGGYGSAAALAPDTLYRLFMIGHTDGSVDFGFDVATTASTLLAAAQVYDAGWQRYRQIGWVYNNAAGDLEAFAQDPDSPDFVRYTSGGLVYGPFAAHSTIVARTLSCVPINAIARVVLRWDIAAAAAANDYRLGIYHGSGATTPIYQLNTYADGVSREIESVVLDSKVDASQQVQARGNRTSADAEYEIEVLGYTFDRRAAG